ncbi:MAG: YbbR-like domain-containing protein [Bacteroidota bacterium]|nr:YbbR-like domain-containing protein [Bacteroidota bacterium]
MLNDFRSRLQQRFPRRRRLQTGSNMSHRGITVTLSVVAATVLWFGLSLSDEYTKELELETRVVNLHNDSAWVSLPPATVSTRIRGRGFDLLRTRFYRPVLELNAALSAVETPPLLEVSTALEVLDVEPSEIRLVKDERVIRRVPVESNVQLEPASGYGFFNAPRFVPDSVTVSGARSMVNAIDAWPTEHSNVRRVRDSLVMDVAIDENHLDGIVAVRPTSVKLTAQTYQFTEGERVLPVMVTDLPTTQQGVQLEPANITVRFLVPLAQYDAALNAPDMFATVSYETIRLDRTGWVAPVVNLPSSLMIAQTDVSPSRLRYFISIGSQ